MKSRVLRLVFCLLLLPVTLFAQDDEPKPEAKAGHPAIPAYPGFSVSNSEYHEFGSYEFHIGPNSTKRLEGKVWEIAYDANEGVENPSRLQIVRNFKNAFQKKNGSVVYAEEDDGLAVFKLSTAKGELWAELSAHANGQYSFDVVEIAAMEQKVELTADEMARALQTSGHVALHGILFDTGKAEIKPESKPVLDEVAKLLQSDKTLKLSIDGHTDNVGQPAANLELSQRRAAAVKAALVGRGTDTSRLITQGFGDTKPVGANTTAAGRAQNRRVELVKR